MNALRSLTMALCLLGSLHAQTVREEADAYYNHEIEQMLKQVREEPDYLRRFLEDLAREKCLTNLPAMNEARLLSLRMLQDYTASGGTNLAEEGLRKDLRLLDKLCVRGFFEASAGGNTNFYAEDRDAMCRRGFTNFTEEEIREDPMLFISAMARAHPTLPLNCLNWPPPDTNQMGGVTNFIARHGWNMANPSDFTLSGPGPEPLTGLPWPVIADQSFSAYTVSNWLIVSIYTPSGWRDSHGGLLWSTQTTPPSQVPCLQHYETKALGGGWYGFTCQPEPRPPPSIARPANQ